MEEERDEDNFEYDQKDPYRNSVRGVVIFSAQFLAVSHTMRDK